MSVCIAYPLYFEIYQIPYQRIKAKHFHQFICYRPLDSTTKLENVFEIQHSPGY